MSSSFLRFKTKADAAAAEPEVANLVTVPSPPPSPVAALYLRESARPSRKRLTPSCGLR